jgi:hypothetical protein
MVTSSVLAMAGTMALVPSSSSAAGPGRVATVSSLATPPAWTALSAPLSGIATDPGVTINDVSCGSSSYCVAVGSYYDNDRLKQPLLLTQTSSGWVAQPITLPSDASIDANASLSHVSCNSESVCAAVGTYDVPGGRAGEK